MKRVALLVLILGVVRARNIFQQGVEKGLIPIGSRPLESRERRSVDDDDDRGAQNIYYVSRTPAVWGTAWLTCRQAMNGQLLTVETEAEDQFIRDLLIENHIASVWTSGAFDADLGIWRWVSTGGEIVYSKWLPNQPSASNGAARIVIQNSLFSSGWATVEEDTAGHYICEVRSGPVSQPTPSTTVATTIPTETPAPTTPLPPETTTYVHQDPPPQFEEVHEDTATSAPEY